MNFKRFGRTANLFDYSTITFGKYINASGEEVASSGIGEQSLNHSDYISVDAGMTYTFKCDKSTTQSATTNAFCWFDSGKQLISRELFNADAVTSLILGTATAPINAAYLIMNYRGLHGDTAMLNTGSTPLPYEPYGSTWHDIPHYIMGTSTDTLTTLPAVLYPNDTTATVGLKGQMEQSGTPTPSSPMQPSECGDMTENLFDENAKSSTKGYLQNYYLSDNGTEIPFTDPNNIVTWDTSEYIPIESSTSYYYTDNVSHIAPCICEYDANHNYISSHSFNNTTYISFTTSANTKYVRLSVFDRIDQTIVHMLNLGSEPLPYEPYGVKIPILSGGITTPVYLGEVQTTRKIKKLVLTGEENWQQSLDPNNKYLYADIYSGGGYAVQNENICSHFEAKRISVSNDNQGFGVQERSSGSVTSLLIRYAGITDTVSGFKTYLQQQYAAGTPVCVWYVLAEPTTGIVNEPLRKIGDYADTVSGITIPTIAGTNTLSVDTTLQPSEVTVNYKGWHPVVNVHERESGAWT